MGSKKGLASCTQTLSATTVFRGACPSTGKRGSGALASESRAMPGLGVSEAGPSGKQVGEVLAVSILL